MSGSERGILVLVGVLAAVAVIVFVVIGLGRFSTPAPDLEPRDTREVADTKRETPEPAPVKKFEPKPSRRTADAEPERAAPLTGGIITGRVVDKDKQPLGGIEVDVLAPTNERLSLADREALATVTTSGDGAFAFDGLESGKGYAVRATYMGYAPATMSGIPVSRDEPYKCRDLILRVGGTIRGMVTDDNGNPIAGAKVLALIQRKLGTDIQVAAGPSDVTDGAGYYEIQHLQPGMKTVYAGAEGFATGAVFEIAVEDELDVDEVNIELMRGQMITGTVVEYETDIPLEGVKIVATPTVWKDATRGNAVTDEAGYFEMGGLAKWAYRVQAKKEGFIPSGFQISAGGHSMQFFMVKSGGFRGRVIDAQTGAPIERYTIRYGEARGEEIVGTGMPKRNIDDPDGVFEIYDVNPNTWIVEAWAPGYAYVKSEPIEVAKSQWVDGIELRLGRGASIGGVAVDVNGSPISGATVAVRPDDNKPAFLFSQINPAYLRKARTASDGSFEVRDVGPGTHRLVLEHDDYQKAEVKSVRVGEGDAYDAGNIRMMAGGRVEGFVRLGDGSPVFRATVRIDRADGGEPPYRNRAKTGKDGSYEFRRLPTGSFSLIVEKAPGEARNYPFGEQRATVSEGTSAQIDF